MNEKAFLKIGEKIIKKDELKLIGCISPIDYLNKKIENKNNEKIDTKFLINLLQNELHDLTYSFLNGGFSKAGFLLYPFIKGISKDNKAKLKNIQMTVNILKNHKIDLNNYEKIVLNYPDSAHVADVISSLYKDLEKVQKKYNTKTVKKRIAIKKINLENYQKNDKYSAPIIKLKNFIKKELRNRIIDFHIHGSFATLDYIKGFSDLDTLIIIKKQALNKKSLLDLRKKLYKSRKFLLQVDPLQHHGHMLITEYDMNYYPNSFFPVELFKYSRSLFQEKKLNFKLRDDKIERINRLFWFVNHFRKLNENKNKNLNCYEFKFLLHAISLFPTLYLQAKGINTYKKFSFEKARTDFPKKLWQPIEEMTRIRNNWKSPKTIPLITNYALNPILSYQINLRYWDFIGSVKRLNKYSQKKLISEMYQLSEFAWDKIKAGLK